MLSVSFGGIPALNAREFHQDTIANGSVPSSIASHPKGCSEAEEPFAKQAV